MSRWQLSQYCVSGEKSISSTFYKRLSMKTRIPTRSPRDLERTGEATPTHSEIASVIIWSALALRALSNTQFWRLHVNWYEKKSASDPVYDQWSLRVIIRIYYSIWALNCWVKVSKFWFQSSGPSLSGRPFITWPFQVLYDNIFNSLL